MTLIGVGLLGGSLGLAARRRLLADTVTGYVRREASVRECERAGAVDHATLDLHAAVSGAALVVLCTPIAQMRPLVERMLPALKRGTLITDVGSVKASVARELEPLCARAGCVFVGSHPMAGSEKAGVSAARADLFHDAVCVVTPTPRTPKAALRRIEHLWKILGARLLRLDPETHDELVSRSSHLPHMVAAGLANYVLAPKHPKAQALLCANGFRDTTRIASGSPEMWRDIAVGNHRHLSRALGVFIKDLTRLREAVSRGDTRRLQQFLAQAKARREKWQEVATPTSPE